MTGFSWFSADPPVQVKTKICRFALHEGMWQKGRLVPYERAGHVTGLIRDIIVTAPGSNLEWGKMFYFL